MNERRGEPQAARGRRAPRRGADAAGGRGPPAPRRGGRFRFRRRRAGREARDPDEVDGYEGAEIQKCIQIIVQSSAILKKKKTTSLSFVSISTSSLFSLNKTESECSKVAYNDFHPMILLILMHL